MITTELPALRLNERVVVAAAIDEPEERSKHRLIWPAVLGPQLLPDVHPDPEVDVKEELARLADHKVSRIERR